MQSLIRSKSAVVTGGRGTAGTEPPVQVSITPTLGHHAARGPTPVLVAYCGGRYIEA